MKKKKLPLEPDFWADETISSPLLLLTAFFEQGNLNHYRTLLDDLLLHVYRPAVFCEKYPGQVFIIYLRLRSFVRACYRMQESPAPLPDRNLRGSRQRLLDEESQDPFLVFRRAFGEISLREFDFFLKECIHLALCPYKDLPVTPFLPPYIHLDKMLEAAQMIVEMNR